MRATGSSQTPELYALVQAEPDLVDRIFDYLLAEFPDFKEAVAGARVADLKLAVRSEFAGDRQRIGPRTDAGRRDLAAQILALFNGRNASEVARRLQVGRATVYRCIKQAAGANSENCLNPGRIETAEPVVSGAPIPPPAKP